MRTLYVLGACCALLVAGPAYAQDGGPPEAGPADASPDAGPADASASADAGVARPDAGGVRAGDTEGDLAQRVAYLERVVRGADDLDIPFSDLFAVDLLDDDAVDDRVRQIDRRLVELRDRIPEAVTSTAGTSYEVRIAVLEARMLELRRAFLTLPREQRRARASGDAARQEVLREAAETAQRQRRALEAEQAAEAARKRALAEAEATRERAVKELLAREAELAEVQGRLAARDAELTAQSTDRNRDKRSSYPRIQALILRAQSAKSSTVASLHDRVVLEEDAAVEKLEAALGELDAPLGLPDYDRTPPRLRPGASEAEKKAHRAVQQGLQNLLAYEARVRAATQEDRLFALESWLNQCRALAEARVALLQRLPQDERDDAFDLFASGRATVERELHHLAVVNRALLALRLRGFQSIGSDWRTLSGYVWDLSRIGLLAMLALWLVRRLGRLRPWLDRYQLTSHKSLAWHRRAAFAERNLERFLPVTLYLGVVEIAHYWLALRSGGSLELELVYLTLWWVGVAWVFRVVVGAAVLWLVTRRKVGLSPLFRAKIRRSSRWAALALFAFGLLRDVGTVVLLRGVVHAYVEGALQFVFAIVVIVLLQSWRDDIAEAYLQTWPQGRLARAVAATRRRPHGFFVATFAFVWVLVRSAGILARDFVLGFDQARKALAFLFRKQLERKAEEIGGDGGIEAFPKTLRRAFSAEPVHQGSAAIDRFPDVPALLQSIRQWLRTSESGNWLVLAPRGLGKTSWMNRARETLGEAHPCLSVRIVRGKGSLSKQLCAALEVPDDEAPDSRRAQAFLHDGPKRILFLDDVHRLLYRRLGGYDALDELARLMHSTRHNVFWVVSADLLAWRFALSARPEIVRFRHTTRLGRWSETEIGQLLMARAAASDIVHQFEDLVVEDEPARTDEALARASAAYTRLIWDYANGSPMVANHFWLRSLVPITGNRVRVRLFRAPSDEVLVKLPEPWIFLLAAVMQHETLSAADAAAVLGVPESSCIAIFEQCREDGLLDRIGNTAQYRVDVYWHRALEAHLQRRHLI